MGQSIIYFEDPFWIGVFEQNDDEKLSVAKVTFGTEPSDCEVRDFILDNYDKLRFSPSVDFSIKPEALQLGSDYEPAVDYVSGMSQVQKSGLTKE